MSKIIKTERDWQAEDDARVLASYQDILNDKARLKRAMRAAEKRAKELEDAASSARKSVDFLKNS